jgi:hypothetical protein
MKIHIRDFRAIARADLELDRIALVAGRNEQGKTSLAQAVQAGLAAVPLPIYSLAKKDAARLVREGEDVGSVVVEHGAARHSVEWPACTVEVTDDESAYANEIAVGLEHPFDMKADQRALVLGRYIQAMPSKADLTAAAQDAGYNATAIEKLWESVCAGGDTTGWDETYRKSRDYGAKLKGQWAEATGEDYGSKKAADWQAPGLAGETEATLRTKAQAAAEAVLKLAGQAAVAASNVTRMRAAVEAAKDCQAVIDENTAALVTLRAEFDAATLERMQMPSESGVQSKNQVVPCPACQAPLVLERLHEGPIKLSLHAPELAQAAASRDNRKERAKLDGTIANLRGRMGLAEQAIYSARTRAELAAQAQQRLAEIGDNRGATEGEIAAARAVEQAAAAALKAFAAQTRAQELHTLIARNEQLIGILAPDGLRRRTLAAALGAFNGKLAEIAALAGWPAVRFDESLNAHYGTRPLWAASESGQWRARAIVQLAIAVHDEAAAVVLDGADVLDQKGRNGLFNALKALELRALVCMTFSAKELVPLLGKAGLGASFWIEGGVAEEL